MVTRSPSGGRSGGTAPAGLFAPTVLDHPEVDDRKPGHGEAERCQHDIYGAGRFGLGGGPGPWAFEPSCRHRMAARRARRSAARAPACLRAEDPIPHASHLTPYGRLLVRPLPTPPPQATKRAAALVTRRQGCSNGADGAGVADHADCGPSDEQSCGGECGGSDGVPPPAVLSHGMRLPCSVTCRARSDRVRGSDGTGLWRGIGIVQGWRRPARQRPSTGDGFQEIAHLGIGQGAGRASTGSCLRIEACAHRPRRS